MLSRRFTQCVFPKHLPNTYAHVKKYLYTFFVKTLPFWQVLTSKTRPHCKQQKRPWSHSGMPLRVRGIYWWHLFYIKWPQKVQAHVEISFLDVHKFFLLYLLISSLYTIKMRAIYQENIDAFSSQLLHLSMQAHCRVLFFLHILISSAFYSSMSGEVIYGQPWWYNRPFKMVRL